MSNCPLCVDSCAKSVSSKLTLALGVVWPWAQDHSVWTRLEPTPYGPGPGLTLCELAHPTVWYLPRHTLCGHWTGTTLCGTCPLCNLYDPGNTHCDMDRTHSDLLDVDQSPRPISVDRALGPLYAWTGPTVWNNEHAHSVVCTSTSRPISLY